MGGGFRPEEAAMAVQELQLIDISASASADMCEVGADCMCGSACACGETCSC